MVCASGIHKLVAELSLLVSHPPCSAGRSNGVRAACTGLRLCSSICVWLPMKHLKVTLYPGEKNCIFPAEVLTWIFPRTAAEVSKMFRWIIYWLSSPGSDSQDFGVSSWRTAFLANFLGLWFFFFFFLFLVFSPGCILLGGEGCIVWGFFLGSVVFRWSPAALGPSVKGVCGAELRRSLLLQGGEGSSEQEEAAE